MSHKSEEARAWYGDPTVSKAALRLMGLDPSVVVPPTFSLVWDLPDHREVLAQLPQAYSVVSNPTIQWNKSGRSPARSIENDEIIQVLSEDPLADIGMSLRPKRQIVEKEHAHPPEIVCFLDIEHFDNSDPGRVLADQLGVFRELEGVYRVAGEVLSSYQIPYLAATSVRGYHFYFRVSGNTMAMAGLQTIGSVIEPQVLYRHQHDHRYCKRPYPIETVVEQVFKGSCLCSSYSPYKSRSSVEETAFRPFILM